MSISKETITTSNKLASSHERALRTEFSDHQLKPLQKYFEKNMYLKDIDLETQSVNLNHKSCVISACFQRLARQIAEA